MTNENSTQMSIEKVSELSTKVIQEVEKAVVGKHDILEQIMAVFSLFGWSSFAGRLPRAGQNLDRQFFCDGSGNAIQTHPVHPRSSPW